MRGRGRRRTRRKKNWHIPRSAANRVLLATDRKAVTSNRLTPSNRSSSNRNKITLGCQIWSMPTNKNKLPPRIQINDTHEFFFKGRIRRCDKDWFKKINKKWLTQYYMVEKQVQRNIKKLSFDFERADAFERIKTIEFRTYEKNT